MVSDRTTSVPNLKLRPTITCLYGEFVPQVAFKLSYILTISPWPFKSIVTVRH